MGPDNTTFDIVSVILVGIMVVVAFIGISLHVSGMTVLDAIRRCLIFLAKKKIVKAPKQKLYAVELHVMLDGKVIKKLPVEVNAPGRRAAKFEISKRLTFKTATTATVADLKKHG